MRQIFVDTEWTAVPWSDHSDLLWVGLSDTDGGSFCALSAEARVHPSDKKYVADLLALLTPDVPRLSRQQLAAGVQDFCGAEVEFWAWIPTLESFTAWSKLGPNAAPIYQQCREVDLLMLQSLLKPWPATWPNSLNDLNAAAVAHAVSLPPRAPNHLHPRVHSQWNQQLFALIQAAAAEL